MRIAVVDLEANGFLYDTPVLKQRKADKVFCISVKDLDTNENTLFEPDNISEGLAYLQSFDALVLHNGLGYDIPLLSSLYNFNFEGVIYDTLVLSRLRYPFFKSHSLKAWGERFKFYKMDYDNFDYYEPEMGEYCKQDVEVTAKVFNHLRKQIDIDEEYVRLEHDMVSIQTQSELFGVEFDYDRAMRLMQEISAEMDEIQATVEEVLGYHWEPKLHNLKKDGTLSHHAVNLLERLKTDYPDFYHDVKRSKKLWKSKIMVPEKITLDTKKLLTDRLLEMGWEPTMFTPKGSPKIAETGEACPNLSKIEGFGNADIGKYFVLKHRKALIEGLFRFVRTDGRIPSEANTLGAVTGRYTHRKIANFPAVRSLYGKEIRSLFGVAKGRVQVGCDLAGIEARMLAHFMDDEDYTNEVLNGDIHTKNQLAAGLPDRDSAKTFFYGFLYGAGDAKVGLLVNGTAKEGKEVKEQFLDSLPTLKNLIESKQKEAEKGYILSLDGRPVRITKSEGFDGIERYDTRKALNTLLQSSATIFFKRWLWFIDKKIKEEYLDARLMISYHDEGQWSVGIDDEERFKKVLHEALKATDEFYNVKCRNDIDIKTGTNWEDCH